MASKFRGDRSNGKKNPKGRKELEFNPLEGKFKQDKVKEGKGKSKRELPNILFSFKDFDRIQIPPGQTFEEWQQKGHLAALFDTLCNLSGRNMVDVQTEKTITLYEEFPKDSDFRPPKHIPEDVKWGVIKKIIGQKARVAGYVRDNVFYIVFLDLDHRFWLTEK